METGIIAVNPTVGKHVLLFSGKKVNGYLWPLLPKI